MLELCLCPNFKVPILYINAVRGIYFAFQICQSFVFYGTEKSWCVHSWIFGFVAVLLVVYY